MSMAGPGYLSVHVEVSSAYKEVSGEEREWL